MIILRCIDKTISTIVIKSISNSLSTQSTILLIFIDGFEISRYLYEFVSNHSNFFICLVLSRNNKIIELFYTVPRFIMKLSAKFENLPYIIFPGQIKIS